MNMPRLSLSRSMGREKENKRETERGTWRCIQEGKRPIEGLISKMNH